MNKEFFQVNRNRSKFKKYGRDVKLRYREITQNIDESDFVSFINNPVASIDTLIPLLDKVVFYNQTELAYNISKAVYPKVKDAPGLIPGSEYDFAEAIYMFKWQSIYERLKENQSIERERIISFLEGYGYEISDHYDEIIDCLAGSDPMVLSRLNLTGKWSYLQGPSIKRWIKRNSLSDK